MLLPTILFLRAKTGDRTLTGSPQGITTEIGSLKGEAAWSIVKSVDSIRDYIIIARSNGNAFFVPARAFHGPEKRDIFLQQIERWRQG